MLSPFRVLGTGESGEDQGHVGVHRSFCVGVDVSVVRRRRFVRRKGPHVLTRELELLVRRILPQKSRVIAISGLFNTLISFS